MFEVLLWLSVLVNNTGDLMFSNCLRRKECLLNQDLGFRDVALNLITLLRVSLLWRLIKIRATG